MRYERYVQWISILTKPYSAEIKDDAFTRSTAHVLDGSLDSLAFPILGDNQFPLSIALGMQHAVAWIRSGVSIASSGHCPVRLVQFESLTDVGHFRHAYQITFP